MTCIEEKENEMARNFHKLCRVSPGAVFAAGSLAALLVCAPTNAQNPLVTGKSITLPPLGTQTSVGSLPMNMILTPDSKFAVTTDMGFRQSLHALSVTTGKDVSAPLVFGPVNATGTSVQSGMYYGLAARSNGDGTSTVYVSQGADNKIAVVTVSATGVLTLKDSFSLAAGDFSAGLALDRRGYLYVAINETYPASSVANITTPASMVVLDTATGKIVSRLPFIVPISQLSAPGNPTFSPSTFPLAVAALNDGSKVFVTSQRDGVVYVISTADPTAPTLVKSLLTGLHPISLLLNKDQSKLYVANAHSETVSVVNTSTNLVRDTILLIPSESRRLHGATPTGLALSPSEDKLYVSMGDINAVAVISSESNTLLGFIPAGWYPTGVVVAAGNVLVSNAKGTQTRYPNPGYKQFAFDGQYGLNLIEGNVQTIAVPNAQQLADDTRLVAANNAPAPLIGKNILPEIGVHAGKIKHIIYIVKENRTYDQVLGDLPQGNGDPSLTLFGRDVTPNQHALAERFVLLDNFYDCAEASGDGWPWSTQGQANEYVIKNLPYNYSGRGRNYDFEGANNNYPTGGFPATDPYGALLVPSSPFRDPRTGIAPAIPDVAEAPGGHIWDNVRKKLDLGGTSLTTKYRNYGFFALFGNNSSTPDNYPADAGLQPAGHDLGGVTDIDFRRYDASYADSDGPQIISSPYPLAAYGHYNTPSRYSEWNREFQQYLTADPTGNSVPVFQTVRLMHDHTQGLSAGKHTPRAEVADNDYGVGQLVEAVSKSAIWGSTAIFIIEDDSQDGPDHVDSHRSTCYVISPYITKNSVDHTFYNTDSVLKTMEDLMGIPPLCLYDATATPIQAFSKSSEGNLGVFTATLPSSSILGEVAPSAQSAFLPLMKLSAKMDFVHPDSAPAGLLNEVIWKSIKGMNSNMPAPRHTLIPTSSHPQAPKSAAKATAVARDAD